MASQGNQTKMNASAVAKTPTNLAMSVSTGGDNARQQDTLMEAHQSQIVCENSTMQRQSLPDDHHDRTRLDMASHLNNLPGDSPSGNGRNGVANSEGGRVSERKCDDINRVTIDCSVGGFMCDLRRCVDNATGDAIGGMVGFVPGYFINGITGGIIGSLIGGMIARPLSATIRRFTRRVKHSYDS